MITPITNHVAQALNRIITQYSDKPYVRGLIAAMVTPIQAIETTLEELNVERSIDTAVGVQLDGLGSIVGIERMGLTDEEYRTRIKARILINISEGEPEIIIQIFSLLTGSNFVQLQEQFPAGISLAGEALIPSGLENLFAELIESALPAGVRLNSMSYYNGNDSFSFDGSVFPIGLGFGSIYDGSLGGLFAGLYFFGPFFGFSGLDPNLGGYSSVFDTAEGGRFEA